MAIYNANKHLLTERSSEFTDDGQIVNVVIPSRYMDKFLEFIIERNTI